MRELPDYLRPISGPGDASAAAAAPAVAPGDEGETDSTPGLISPASRGHTGGFITDAIVDARLRDAASRSSRRSPRHGRPAGGRRRSCWSRG